jgi:Spy/CpxP family protein refolding chaperone
MKPFRPLSLSLALVAGASLPAKAFTVTPDEVQTVPPAPTNQGPLPGISAIAEIPALPFPTLPKANGVVSRQAEDLLDLTDAQKAQLNAIRANHEPRMAALMSRIEKLASLASKDGRVISEKWNDLEQALSDLRFSLWQEYRAMRLETRAVLTPEQKEKFARTVGVKEGLREGTMLARRFEVVPGEGAAR